MNYGDAIVEYLRKQKHPEPGKTQVARTRVGDFHFSCELTDFDKFSFVLTRVEVSRAETRTGIAGADARERAEKARKRLSYLGEELEFGEVDTENHRVQLRSRIPSAESGPFCYYELLLTGSEYVSLARFAVGEPGSGRMPRSFQMTAETLAKLVEDLVKTIM